MTRAHVERERKYAVPDSGELPDFSESRLRVGSVQEVHLEAVYFDTPALDLLRRDITLRRREGGEDEGWHVKLPRRAGTKLELHHPLGRAVRTVPRAVKDVVLALVRDQELSPVAVISTRRTVHPVLTQDEPVALLCADHVTARPLGREGSEQAWQEWELELVQGQPASVLDEVEPFLLESGAHRSHATSKLQRILQVDHPDPLRGAHRRARAGDARAALQIRLAGQTRRLLDKDAAFRRDAPEAVHQLRIAARRLRSALSSAKPLFDEPPDELRAELRWFGQQLGPARDVQVLQQRLRAAVDAEPDDLVLGPVRRRIDLELNRRRKAATATVADVLSSERYFRLLDGLDSLVEELAHPLNESGPVSVAQLVRRDARRLRRAARAVDHAGPDERDGALHEARKKAKRLRYAAELAGVAGGRRVTRLAKRAKAVQSALGEHQDTVVARQALRELGAAAYLNGENGFTFGLLAGTERLAAEDSERRFRAAWARMPSPRKAARWVTHG